MGQVVWTKPALEHLREIVNYVAQDSPARAIALMNRLLEAPRQLEHLGRLGRQVPEFGQEPIRELLVVRPYRIIYVVRDDTCSIVAIVHGRRDLSSLLQPEDLDDT